MELIYQFVRIVPSLPFLASIPIGLGLFILPKSTRSLRRIWATTSISSLGIAMLISLNIFWQQITGNSIYRCLWSWIFNKNITFEVGFLIDPLTSIMLVSITTVGVLVMIHSDSYMSHDQGYVRFFAYLSLPTASMPGSVPSPNSIQIYIFWELVGMCSHPLIGFRFTRPSAANARQKASITNRVGDFGLLLGISGFYRITGSSESEASFKRFNELLANNEVTSWFATPCALSLFLGPVAKSAQFPLHVWLPDATEGPTPISAPIHAATTVAAGIFLVARPFPLFQVSPSVMGVISWIGAITALLGATIALAQKDLKKGLAYPTTSQSGYMMLAPGIGSYRAGSFHPITHAHSKASSSLGSGSVIHSMEPIVGYCPDKSQNMAFMGGLRKYMPITGTTLLPGTLSLCGIPPLACFWSKDEIPADSWLYLPTLGWIAWVTAGPTAFHMFRIYFLTFEGDFRANLSRDSVSVSSASTWGKVASEESDKGKIESVSQLVENEVASKESSKSLEMIQKFSEKKNPVLSFSPREKKKMYPKESDNTMLFPLLILTLPTSFIGFIGAPLSQGQKGSDLSSHWLDPSFNHSHEVISENWSQFLSNAITSVSTAFSGMFIAFISYGPIPSFSRKLQEEFEPSSEKFSNPFFYFIYNWSYFRGYIDGYYDVIFVKGIRTLAKFSSFFDEWVIDGVVNGVGISAPSGGEGVRYAEGGRVSSYLFGLIFGTILLLFIVFLIW
uniref:NAD(P)H-quinone oxidoreductase subunit 5, chloroplastic n=2 Tax=Takakia lepidozioides TaxID=37425 RepID=A0A0S3QPE4_TAKLE|nr:NADH dehydrogenase ND5 subunit [Takakia lepidozioides]UPM51678.1 NADH-plastoquinone oxidoreductase subunit 5 [Takakia lepidozioides]